MAKRVILFAFFFLANLHNYAQQGQEELIQEKGALIESVAALSSTNLYLSYLSISMIKSDIENGIFRDKFLKIIGPLESALNIISGQIAGFKNLKGLSGPDLEILENIETAVNLFKEDTALLKAYLAKKDEKLKKEFDKKHKEVGDFLKNLYTGKGPGDG